MRVNNPIIVSQKRNSSKITFYKNFEEQANDRAHYQSKLSPEDRMIQAMELIKRVYGERKLSIDFPGKIRFKKISL